MAQFPFRNAILKLRVEKIPKRASRRAFFLLRYKPPMTKLPATAATDLPELRKQIIELVAQNAVPMVQQAIDAVRGWTIPGHQVFVRDDWPLCRKRGREFTGRGFAGPDIT
jgi:hypothetical protein